MKQLDKYIHKYTYIPIYTHIYNRIYTQNQLYILYVYILFSSRRILKGRDFFNLIKVRVPALVVTVTME